MTDTYGPEAIDDLFLGPSERLRRLTSPQDMATQAGVSDVDEDPDQAARAIQLSRATGTPAGVIHGDLEGFEREHKQRLVGEMIRNSEALQDYVNTFPMAGKVSNDDYPVLDAIHQKIKAWRGTPLAPAWNEPWSAIWEGIKEGWGDEDLMPPVEEWRKAVEYFGGGEPGKMAADAAYLAKGGIDLLSRVFKAGMHGAAKGGAQVGQAVIGLDEPDRKALEREIGSMLEWAMNRGDIGTIMPKLAVRDVVAAAERAKPYLDAGEIPPPGVDPWLDKIKEMQAEADLKSLKEVQKEVKGSKTFERSPEAGEYYLKQQLGNQTIGISADAVAELYKGKRPLPDDGLLGWVPDLEQQMAVAIETGGDIKVPLASWLAKMDPAVAKDLEEHLRLRPQGVTKFEATEQAQVAEPPKEAGFTPSQMRELLKEEDESLIGMWHTIKEPIPENASEAYKQQIESYRRQVKEAGIADAASEDDARGILSARQGRPQATKPEVVEGTAAPTPQVLTAQELVRREAGFEPLAQVGDRGIRLEPKPGLIGTDSFNIMSEGKPVGTVDLRLRDNGQLHMDYVMAFGGPQALGLHSVRGLLDEIRRQYPEAKTLVGRRISGAREEAGKGGQAVEISLDRSPREIAQALGWDSVETSVPREPVPEGTIREPVTERIAVEFRPTELYTQHEADLSKAVDDILKQMAPKAVGAAVDRVEIAGQQVHGVIQPAGGKPHVSGQQFLRDLILVSMRPGAPLETIGTAMHEVMHHLRSGFWTADEWSTLERAAKRNNWIDRHSIESRYENAPDWLKLEESIAEQFREWGQEKLLVGAGLDKEITSLFQRLKDFLDAVAQRVREIFGQPVGFEQLFEKAASGEIGAREQTKTGTQRFAKAQELAQTFEEATKAEEQQMFAKGAAIGMTQDQFKRYMNLIDQKRQEIEDRAKRRAERATQVTKTEQWKENEPRVREEVTEAINRRPDVMADDYFRRGLLDGEKVTRPKLGTEFLTEEQQKALGPGLHREGGANPSDIAGLFGYFSGEDMVNAMAKIQEAREAYGMSPEAYKRKLIRETTDKVMMKRYGVPEHDALLREMREDIITETQMDMLAEETMALATKTGQAPTFEKGQLKESVKELFAKTKMADARDMEGFLRNAGKAGAAAERALLKGDPAEAFRQKQRQYIATLFANEAKALGKLEASMDKTAKRLAPRLIANREMEYIDYAQKMLRMAGYSGKMSIPELEASMQKYGFKDFETFVLSKQADKWEISAPDWILDWKIPKVDEMTSAQFKEFKDVVDVLDHTAREARKVEVNGQARDFDEFKKEVRENIKQLKALPAPDDPGRGLIRKGLDALYRFDSTLTKIEEVVKDLDLRQELGPLWGALFHPLVDAKHTEMGKQERLTKDLGDVRGFGSKWRKTLSDPIPNEFFMDPWFEGENRPFNLTRSDLIGIMLYWGNRSNIKKLTEGYAGKDHAPVLESHLKDLMDRYATKEDWDFVKKLWSLSEPLRADAGSLYHRLAGREPKWIPPEPFDTPYGQMPGGFFPIFWDPHRSRLETRMHGSFFDENFQGSTTSNHYTIERTGYVDRVNFRGGADMYASRLQQMIHDISFREPIMNAQKVLKDSDIRSDIIRHYGKEYLEKLESTFKNLANQFNLNEKELAVWQNVLRATRGNLIVHFLGYNMRVIATPATGKFGLRDLPQLAGQIASQVPLVRDIANWNDNYKLGLDKSRELPHTFRNMDRDFRERLDNVAKNNNWSAFKTAAFRWAMAPTVWVDQQFRTVTFVNEYKAAKARGLSEGEAVSLGDAAVRERHGAAGIADLAPIMQSKNEFTKLATLFYGFFSTSYNFARPIAGELRRGEFMEAFKRGWWSVGMPAIMGAAFFNQSKENDSIFKIGSKAIALQVAGTLPLGREMATALLEGHPSNSPWGSLIQSIGSTVADVTSTSGRPRKTVQHTANTIGLSLGLPLGQVGRTGQFITDVAKNRQQPRTFWEYVRGIIHGEARLKK